MAVLKAQVFGPDCLYCDPLGELTDFRELTVQSEHNGIGSGSVVVPAASAQAAWLQPNNFVGVYRDTITVEPWLGFFIDDGGDTIVSPDEDGGLLYRRGGPGPIQYMADGVVWHRKTRSSVTGTVRRKKGDWLWKNAHPGQVLYALMRDAIDRNVYFDIDWDFTAAEDSAGNPWPADDAQRFTIPIGTNLLDVIRQLRDTGLYVSMSPYLTLSAWATDPGIDLSGSITLAEGSDIRDASERQVSAGDAVSNLLVEGENRQDVLRYRTASNSDVRTALGRRREGFFRYTRTATAKVLKRVADRRIDRYAKQREGPFTLGIIDTPGNVAGLDYNVGDTVTVNIPGTYDSVAERIASITVEQRPEGEYDPIVEFADMTRDPMTGSVDRGDSSGGDCGDCGDGGVGGQPGSTGGGTSSGGGGTGGDTDVKTYVLDDYNRTSGGATPGYACAGTEIGTAAGVSNVYSEGTTYVYIPIPDGADVVGRVLIIYLGWTDRDDADVQATMEAAGYKTFTGSQQVGGTDRRAALFYRIIDGTENGGGGFPATSAEQEITFADPATPTVRGVSALYDFIGIDGVDPEFLQAWILDPSVTLDPDAVTPPWSGFEDRDGVVFLTAAFTDGQGAFTAKPSGYSPAGDDVDSFSVGVSLDRKFDNIENGVAEDPSAYVVAAGSGYGSLTVAIKGVCGPGESQWSAGDTPEPQANVTEYSSVGGTSHDIPVPTPPASYPLGGLTLTVFMAYERFLGANYQQQMTSIYGFQLGYDSDSGRSGPNGAIAWVRFRKRITSASDPLLSPGAELNLTSSDALPSGITAVGFWTVYDWLDDGSVNQSSLPDPDQAPPPGSFWPDGDMYTGWLSSYPGMQLVAAIDTGAAVPGGYNDIGAAGGLIPMVVGYKIRSGWDEFEMEHPSMGAGTLAAGYIIDATYNGGTPIVPTFVGGGGGDPTDIGTILTREQNGAWWEGGNKYEPLVVSVNLLIGVNGSELVIASEATNQRAFYRLPDPAETFYDPGPTLPFNTRRFNCQVDWEIDVLGDLLASFSRYYAWSFRQDDQEVTFQLRLGDGSYGPGVRIADAATDEYQAVALTTDTLWTFEFEWEDFDVRARLYPAGAPTPDWQVSTTVDDFSGNSFSTMQCILGNDGPPAQTLKIDEIRVRSLPEAGDVVERHLLQYGDGSTVTFTVGQPYEPNTLTVWIDGIPISPIADDPDAGQFTLAEAPYGDPAEVTGGSPVEVSYTKGVAA